MQYFKDAVMISADPALQERIAASKTPEDIETNTGFFLHEALGEYSTATDLPLNRPLAVVCAAGDIKGERLQALNDKIREYCVILAGAGAYTQPSDMQLLSGEYNDKGTFIDPEDTHAAITNFSVGNSHTKPFGLLRDQIIFVASHCASDPIDNGKGGMNDPTIGELLNNDRIDKANLRIFHSYLGPAVPAPRGKELIGTGTGAPPAAIALISALRQQAGITAPLEVELFGFDGTNKMLDQAEIPVVYEQRLEGDQILVRIDGDVFEGQRTFLKQTKEIIHLAHTYPSLIGSVKVDGPQSFNARIFNVDGLPRKDFEVFDPAVGRWENAFQTGSSLSHGPSNGLS